MIRRREIRNMAMLSAITSLVLLVCLPAAAALGATYYVSTEGNDTNAGTSSKLAWRTIAHAAKQAQAGDLVLIRGGDYGAEHVVISNSGTAEAPIVFAGYDGQVKLEGTERKVKGKIKPDGGIGINISGKSYVKLSGITILKYSPGIMITGGSHHITVERCTAGICGWAGIALNRGSHHCQVTHCTAYTSGMINIGMYGCHDITIADCWSYQDRHLSRMFPSAATHYCYAAAGSWNVEFTRCRGDGRTHTGHGLEFTRGSPGSRNCRVTDCEMNNCWTLFGVRHGGHDITFVNCYGQGRQNLATASDHGFYFRTGAKNILVKNCRVRGVSQGLHAAGGDAKRGDKPADNVTFENCIATHCNEGICVSGEATNAKILNCLSARNKVGISVYNRANKPSLGLSITGCIVCQNETGVGSSIIPAKAISRCNVWGNKTDFAGKAKPGAGCLSKDPQFGNKGGRTPNFGDWRLTETSPCKDMGPYAADPKATIGMR